MSSLSPTISWILVHSLWIAFACWLFAWLLSPLFKKSSHQRSFKLFSVLLFVTGMTVCTFLSLRPADSISNPSSTAILSEAPPVMSITGFFQQIDHSVDISSQVIVLVWLLGIAYGLIKLVSGHRILTRYKGSVLSCHEPRVIDACQRVGQKLKIRRNITLLISPLINSPMTTGILKPIVYLPAGLLSGFTSDELDAIFLHELMHIKRHDYVLVLLLSTLETVFFFNPFFRLMSRDLRKEMEFACDEGAIHHQNKIIYARSLLRLQENEFQTLTPALGLKGNNGEFRERIERIIQKPKTSVKPLFGILPVVALATILLSASNFKTISKSTTPLRAESEHLEPNLSQDTETPAKQDTAQTITLEWPHDSDTLVYKDIKFVWAGKGLPTKKIMIRPDQLPKGQQVVRVIISAESLRKSEEMLAEIQAELIKDGFLTTEKQKLMLMFQYSDILNGKSALGDKYEKYVAIFNRHYPVYDSFATTRIFRYRPN